MTEGLLKLVRQTVEDYNFNNPQNRVTKVKGIACVAGLLSCFEPKALADCFEIFAEGTICENAVLSVDYKPLACSCKICGNKFSLDRKVFQCPRCESAEIEFTGGHGLDLISLDVECEENNG